MASNTEITAIRQPDDELATVRAELAALKAKMERKNEIAEVVTEAMMDERRKNFGKITPPDKFVMPAPNGEKLIKMTLDRHYKPVGFYEVIGYNKEEVVKKRSDGTTIVTERAEFIPDIVKPYPISGVGFQNKIWAGTVLKVQENEAKQMRADRIATYEID